MNQPNLETHDAGAVVTAQLPASSHDNGQPPLPVSSRLAETNARIIRGPWCNDGTGFSYESEVN